MFRKIMRINLDRLLPFIGIRNHMQSGCDSAERMIFVVGAKKTSSAAGLGFNLDDIRAYSLNDAVPVHGDGVFLFLENAKVLPPAAIERKLS